jgi:hypothetical protein
MAGLRRQVVADLCPVCGAAGLELCAEEDGQYVLDHWGRPVELSGGTDRAALSNVALLAVA